jgi:hypothetical protein
MAALALIGRLRLVFLDEAEEVDEAQRFPSVAVLDDDHGDNVMVVPSVACSEEEKRESNETEMGEEWRRQQEGLDELGLQARMERLLKEKGVDRSRPIPQVATWSSRFRVVQRRKRHV